VEAAVKEIAKRIDHLGQADLSEWNLGDLEPVEVAIKKVITDLLESVFTDSPPRISFPWEYGPKEDGRNGPPASDPLVVYVETPLGQYDGDGPGWSYNLRDIVEEIIEYREDQRTKMVYDEEGKIMLRALAASFRSLAEMIDCRISLDSKPT
jgi:hypothetical protein